MKSRKVLSVLLSTVLAIGMLSGCGAKEGSDKVSIKIGNWKTEGQSGYELQMEKLEKFRAAHPEIEINTDTYAYDTKNFVAKAAAGQLPTAFDTYFTEVKQIAKQGYCADISKALEKTGLKDALNPKVLEIVTGENGEIWGLPHNAYAQGLAINKKLFKEAGLVNEDGTIKVPNTYDDVLEFAKIVKEKTGKAGFVIPTVENCGGWHMMNIAWSYGTEFMKEENGKWIATFDSQEFKDACQWLYDMKWKYNGLVDNSVVNNGDRSQLFGTYQAAMMFSAAPESDLVSKYGMKIEDIAVVRMPEGPKGRVSQSGGAVWMFSNKASEEEIEACLKWFMEQGGFETEITDETLANSEKAYQDALELGTIILPQACFPTFSNRKGEEKYTALMKKYTNVDEADWMDFIGFKDVTVRAEEPVCCQQLYSVIDGIVQKIITDKNVDIDAAIKEGVKDFQQNHLDTLQ